MSDIACYSINSGRKLCIIVRDNPRVHIQPMRDAFGGAMRFEVVERNLGNGESAREVLEYLSLAAKNKDYEGYSCLVVVMAGCYNARDGSGISVSGLDADFHLLIEPFVKSLLWFGKPKVFIVQFEKEDTPTVCCDARVIPLFTDLPEFADTALVLGYGGEKYLYMLRDLIVARGGQLEFHKLMSLFNGQVRDDQGGDASDEAPIASGFFSQLTKALYLSGDF